MRVEELKEKGLPSEEILEIVRAIRQKPGSVKVKKEWAMRTHPDFCERYEVLLNMACEEAFDMGRLEYMIRMREAIQQKVVTLDSASAHVGQALFDEYVRPKMSDMEATDHKI